VRIGTSLCGLSYAAVLQGDNERATALCEEALAYADKHEDAGDIIVRETLINLGLAALGRGDHGRAISSFERSLAMSQSAGRKPSLINALEGMASLAGAQGDAPRAARLWGAAEAGREATSIALPPGDRALHEPYLASARSRLGVAAWEEALSKGRAMSLDEAAEYALAEDEPDTSTSSMSQALPNDEPVSSLTRREREVATLVARGCTNRQVANELSISERTAGNHVAKVLKKLGLASRVQIASWVTERRSLAADQE
jgi:DNA-binding CsgD family transcriptional regulator